MRLGRETVCHVVAAAGTKVAEIDTTKWHESPFQDTYVQSCMRLWFTFCCVTHFLTSLPSAPVGFSAVTSATSCKMIHEGGVM